MFILPHSSELSMTHSADRPQELLKTYWKLSGCQTSNWNYSLLCSSYSCLNGLLKLSLQMIKSPLFLGGVFQFQRTNRPRETLDSGWVWNPRTILMAEHTLSSRCAIPKYYCQGIWVLVWNKIIPLLLWQIRVSSQSNIENSRKKIYKYTRGQMCSRLRG